MMESSVRIRAVACAIAVVFLLGACAGRGENRPAAGRPDPDSVVSTTVPSPSSPAPEPTPLLVTPRAGLVDVRPNPYEKVVVLDERTLEVRFWGGVEDCYGVDRVEVEYREPDVTLTLFQGRVPTAEACIEIAVLTAVRVKLDEPLAGREIVDGAPSSG